MPSKVPDTRPTARIACAVVAIIVSSSTSPAALAQATSRPCDTDPAKVDRPGPACLLAHRPVGRFAGDAVYWHLATYPDARTARTDREGNATVVEAFGKVWLFTVGTSASGPLHGTHIARVGPIPVNRDIAYDAAFLQSTFSPGMKAPVHVHSGPEAFYAVSGDTCLETPAGARTARGPGNSLVIEAGPPMLLMAVGPEPRKGFALILHDARLAPTTLVHNWTPSGLCAAQAR